MPQTDATSLTQIESHELLQQYESTAQIEVTHGSQPVVSLPPVEQMGCAQVGPPLQLLPHTEATSLTHSRSHAVAQQYESTRQMAVTHVSQPDVSVPPVLHSSWAHCEPQVWPHTEPTSPTQIESHPVVQQYGSTAQIDDTQALQPLASAPPVVQSSCAQVTVPWHWPSAEQVWPDGQLPHEPEQPSGPHALPVHCGVQVVPPVTMQAPALFDHCFCTT